MICVRVSRLYDRMMRARSRRCSNNMAATPLRAAFLLVVLAVAGCSRSDMWPMLTGEPRRSDRTEAPASDRTSTADANVAMAPLPAAGGTMMSTTTYSGAPSTTFVGQKVQQLRGDLQRLQSQVGDHQGQLQQVRDDALQNGQRYYSSIAAINARLQIGTTPGNPLLVQQWNDAQGNLDRIGDDIGRLNNLANLVTGDSALTAYILETTR